MLLFVHKNKTADLNNSLNVKINKKKIPLNTEMHICICINADNTYTCVCVCVCVCGQVS